MPKFNKFNFIFSVKNIAIHKAKMLGKYKRERDACFHQSLFAVSSDVTLRLNCDVTMANSARCEQTNRPLPASKLRIRVKGNFFRIFNQSEPSFVLSKTARSFWCKTNLVSVFFVFYLLLFFQNAVNVFCFGKKLYFA